MVCKKQLMYNVQAEEPREHLKMYRNSCLSRCHLIIHDCTVLDWCEDEVNNYAFGCSSPDF